jgi:hypothetical protein
MKWTDLDLEISLSPSQVAAIEPLIEKFLSRDQHYFCEPVLEGSILKINSSDFVNFLDQAEFGNEFDHFRLRQSAVKNIEAVAQKKKSTLEQKHYFRCAELLKEL